MSDTEEHLGQAPEGWTIAALGNVTQRIAKSVTVTPGHTYREIGIRSHGKGIFHKEPVDGATLGAKRVFEIVPGCLVLNIVFAWEGAVAVTTERERGMIASHRFPMLAPSAANRIDVEFLRRFFQTKRGVQLLGEASPGGAGRNRTLNQKFAAQIPIPLPPLGEQRKIAAILSSVDDAVEATQAVIDQLQVLKKALMSELLTRGLPGRHTKFKMTEIGEVPEPWDVLPVSALGETQLGKMRSPVHTKGRMRPYLRVANVLDGEIRPTVVLEMLFEDDEWEKFRLREGDILLNEGQSLDLVGRSAIYRGVPDDCAFQKTLLRFRGRGDMVSEFMQAQFQHCLYTGRFAENAVQTTSIAHLTGVRFANMKMARPPVAEQEQIAAIVGALESRQDAESRCASALRGLKASLMSVLLTGEVRVKSDEGNP